MGMIVKYEKDTTIFTPNLHFDCDSRWYFKKGEPTGTMSVLRSDFKKGGWADWRRLSHRASAPHAAPPRHQHDAAWS